MEDPIYSRVHGLYKPLLLCIHLKKSPPLQIDSTPAKYLTLGVNFEPKLAQYAGYFQEVYLYYPRPSNASVSESG